MSRYDSDITSKREGSHSSLWVKLFSAFLLCLFIGTDFLGGWNGAQVTHAATASNPNPTLAPPNWLQSQPAPKVKDLGIYVKGKQDTKVVPLGHPKAQLPPTETLKLTPGAQRFVTRDGHLELDIAAGTVSTEQLQAAGGSIQLQVVPIDAGGGGSLSGHVMLGTYQFNVQDAAGKALPYLVLAHELTIQYHLLRYQAGLLRQGQVVYALWDKSAAKSGPTANASTTKATPRQAIVAQVDKSGLAWSVSSNLNQTTSLHVSGEKTANTLFPANASSGSTITFSTQAPEASWGTPSDFQVGLNSGGLNYSYPIALPSGSGGFNPPLKFMYSSGSVNESHNMQGTATWVGEGWNLNMGSISWSQENVTPGGTNRLENVWSINDPGGISGQLIPPDFNAATSAPTSPAMDALPAQYIWHTAPESHAKIQEVNFNGQPCWHVWLPSGVMEEFGCTDEARQSAKDTTGTLNPYRWDLNLMVDRHGNQIRVHYQRNWPAGEGIRDAVVSSIEYDDPSCHNTSFNGATAGCSSWNPKVKLIFDASSKVERLNNSDCQGWSDNSTRCDDPVDLTSSGGVQAPKATNAYVLNDVQVQINGNLLHKYLFSYEQSHPYTITDPVSGQQESTRGYLDLTKIEEHGTNDATLNAPTINISYQEQKQHYSDENKHATPSTNCGTSWSPRDGSGCYLWYQSYNARYITTLDNGRGWHQNITWKEARSNVHGVDSGALNDVFTCDGQESATNLCSQADDTAWSRIVVSQRQAITNGITSTWNYKYYLRTNWPAPPCSNCNQGYMWGNINDGDYADFYNYTFTSFASAQITNPDNSSQVYNYASSDGIGIASNSITCYASVPCHPAPYSNLDPDVAGKSKHEEDYGTDGKLLTVHDSSYATNCPPSGVGHSGNASGAPNDIGDTQLSSQLDRNNPVVVCDPRAIQQDDYTVDGVTDSNNYKNDTRVLHKQTNTSYDSDNQGSHLNGGYDYGNVSRVDVTGNDVNNEHFIAGTTYYPYDDVGAGIYLTGLPAYGFTLDAGGKNYSCTASVYGSNSDPFQSPSVPSVARNITFVNNGGCTGTSFSTYHTYDASGTAITGTDADGHKGCTNGSDQYSACATYDDFGTHLTSGTDAKKHITKYGYDSSASGGFGQWLMSTTDINGQTTTYQYDALGRITATIRPGDSASTPTVSYNYINTCTNGSTAPCLEIDTTTRINSNGSTTLMKQWYDGMGRQVETIKPGATMLSRVPAIPSVIVTYTIYDAMGRSSVVSMPYAVPNYSGSPGATASAYATPDQTQPRSLTRYDGAGRSLGNVTYSNATTILLTSTITYSVAQGVSGFNADNGTTFEQVKTIDAYNHQQLSYNDALGRNRYTQVYSGTGAAANPYNVIRTMQYNRDTIGNVTSVLTLDGSSKQLAYRNTNYDGVKRITGWNDADDGSCSTTPLPAGCSNSSDTAWKVTYDNDGNQLTQTDSRGQTTYSSFDALDRLLCRGTSSAAVNPCQKNAYALFFYDSYDNSSNPTVSFPTGCVAPSGSYTSDPVGTKIAEVFSATAGSGWRCSGYNNRGKQDLSSLSVTADNQTTNQTIYMGYNEADQLSSLTYPDGEVITSTYDDNGLFRSMSDANGAIASSVQYTHAGQIAGMTLGGLLYQNAQTTQVKIDIGYDGIQRPLSSDAIVNGNTIFNQTRTYDNVGNVLQLSTTLPTTTGGSKTDAQSYCYDELNRVAWAGNSGTPTGGDHCGLAPSGSTVSTYKQPFSYDAADRITNGSAGTESYDSTHPHAATSLGTVPNPYASYDAMGNMICRNIDTTTAHSCDPGTQTGAVMTYDNEGRLDTWTAPGGTTGSDKFLYDNEGHRVLQRTSNTTGSVTDTITFDGYTETNITGGSSTTIKYYSANGQRIAMSTSSGWYYLVPDVLGSTTLALNSNGTVKAAQLFAPYGSVRYTDGSMPTTYNFTGQRLDSQTGLLYYDFRYYDPVSGRFVRTDTTQTNAQGMDPYAYVGDNPTGRTDPTGHCWPLCTMVLGAVIGAAVNVAVTTATSFAQGHPPSAGALLQSAAVGAVTGAITGAVGPEAGPIARVAAGAIANGAGTMVGNAISGKPLMDGVGESVVAGAVTGGLMEGAGALLKDTGSSVVSDIEHSVEDQSSGKTDFYSVLSKSDRDRLRYNGGEPWPTGKTQGAVRDAYGPGVYAWSTEEDAQAYLATKTDPSYDTQITSFSVNNDTLSSFNAVDLTTMSDENATNWMIDNSPMYGGTMDPSVQYVTRGTGNYGVENFFSTSVFDSLNWDW